MRLNDVLKDFLDLKEMCKTSRPTLFDNQRV